VGELLVDHSAHFEVQGDDGSPKRLRERRSIFIFLIEIRDEDLCAPDRVGRALQVPFNLDCLLAIHDAPFAPLGAVSYVFE
jgi:hypothetical protein